MKNYTLSLVLLFLSFSIFGSQKTLHKIDYKYESTVVINIKKHTNEEIQLSQDLLLKNSELAIDYKCLASGVIVFKLSHNFTHESDIKHFVYKALGSKIPVNRIGILFADIHSKTSQC